MKLSALNVTIRETKAVLIPFTMPSGATHWVRVTKTDFLKALKSEYDGQRTAETGLKVNSGGRVIEDSFALQTSTVAGVMEALGDDDSDGGDPVPSEQPASSIDDLLGGDPGSAPASSIDDLLG
jgi:hypothetical protein